MTGFGEYWNASLLIINLVYSLNANNNFPNDIPTIQVASSDQLGCHEPQYGCPTGGAAALMSSNL